MDVSLVDRVKLVVPVCCCCPCHLELKQQGMARHGGRCWVAGTSCDTQARRRLEPGRCVAVTQ